MNEFDENIEKTKELCISETFFFFFTQLLFHKLVCTFFSTSTQDSGRVWGIAFLLIGQNNKATFLELQKLMGKFRCKNTKLYKVI